jgi:hypothetical protein
MAVSIYLALLITTACWQEEPSPPTHTGGEVVEVVWQPAKRAANGISSNGFISRFRISLF